LTGRSAACAPLMANRPAAEPRKRLLTIFMLTSKLCFVQKPVQSGIDRPRKNVEDQRILLAKVDLSEPPRTGRPRDAPLRRGSDKNRRVLIKQQKTDGSEATKLVL
jgi:hypothetical protein